MTLQFNFTSSNAGIRSNNLEVIENLQEYFENEENEFKEFFEDGTISFEKSDEVLAVYGDSSYYYLTKDIEEFELNLAKAIKTKMQNLNFVNDGGDFHLQILGFRFLYSKL